MARSDRLILALQALGKGGEAYFQRKQALEEQDRLERIRKAEQLQKQQQFEMETGLKGLELMREKAFFNPLTGQETYRSPGFKAETIQSVLPGFRLPEDTIPPVEGKPFKTPQESKSVVFSEETDPEDLQRQIDALEARGYKVSPVRMPSPGQPGEAKLPPAVQLAKERIETIRNQVNKQEGMATRSQAAELQNQIAVLNNYARSVGQPETPAAEFMRPGVIERLWQGGIPGLFSTQLKEVPSTTAEQSAQKEKRYQEWKRQQVK